MKYIQVVADIKFLIKNSRFVVPIIAFVAVAEIFIYYEAFEINVSSFVSFSEFFLLAIDDSLIRIVVAFLVSFSVAAFIPEKAWLQATEDRIKMYKSSFFKRQKRNGFPYFAITLQALLYFFFRGRHNKYEYFGTECLIMALFFLFFIIRDEFLFMSKTVFSESIASLHNAILSGVLLLFLLSNALIEKISNVKLKKEKRKTFMFADRSITCEDSIKYIGKTTNYLFFYNKKLDESFVVPTAELKESNFKN